jgi:hypothetical protein
MGAAVRPEPRAARQTCSPRHAVALGGCPTFPAGDGTVLWTCHIFGNQSVPPVVPFNMGSLGFLTPFDPSSADRILEAVMDGEARDPPEGWQTWQAGAEMSSNRLSSDHGARCKGVELLGCSFSRRACTSADPLPQRACAPPLPSAGGFPIMLRHRLHAHIVRARWPPQGAAAAAAAAGQ